MALAGGGAICIWNDITDAGREDFYAWHLTEHMPERAAVPGFLRSRRYIALDQATSPEFFTFYETVDQAVMTSAAYLARLNAPTPWTKKATQEFRNTSRALTHVEASLGPGSGGVLATLRFAVASGRRADAIAVISRDALPQAAAAPQICGAHLCVTDEAASAARTAESRDRSDIQTAPSWIILLEGCGEQAVRAAAVSLQQAIAPLCEGDQALGLYRFEYQC